MKITLCIHNSNFNYEILWNTFKQWVKAVYGRFDFFGDKGALNYVYEISITQYPSK